MIRCPWEMLLKCSRVSRWLERLTVSKQSAESASVGSMFGPCGIDHIQIRARIIKWPKLLMVPMIPDWFQSPLRGTNDLDLRTSQALNQSPIRETTSLTCVRVIGFDSARKYTMFIDLGTQFSLVHNLPHGWLHNSRDVHSQHWDLVSLRLWKLQDLDYCTVDLDPLSVKLEFEIRTAIINPNTVPNLFGALIQWSRHCYTAITTEPKSRSRQRNQLIIHFYFIEIHYEITDAKFIDQPGCKMERTFAYEL